IKWTAEVNPCLSMVTRILSDLYCCELIELIRLDEYRVNEDVVVFANFISRRCRLRTRWIWKCAPLSHWPGRAWGLIINGLITRPKWSSIGDVLSHLALAKSFAPAATRIPRVVGRHHAYLIIHFRQLRYNTLVSRNFVIDLAISIL